MFLLRQFLLGFFLVFACLAFLSPRAAAAGDDPAGDTSVGALTDYIVGPNDVLKVEVYGEPDLTREAPVLANGVVDLPFLGLVAVGGLSVDAIGQLLEDRWGADYLVDPHVTVRVLTYGSQAVQVIGAVLKPQQIFLTRPTTVLEAISLAGGVVSEKSAREVQVKRNGGANAVTVSLDRLVSGGEGNILLQAGDVVYVPEGLYVYVMGEVNKPGPITYFDGLTVNQAVTAAGGFKTTARMRVAHITRDGTQVRFSPRRIIQGRDEDPPVKPGDQVFIAESVF